MNKKDLKNDFPNPTEHFHDRLCSVLNNLEEERVMNFSVKKGIIIAVAVVALIGTTAFATVNISKRITYGSTSSVPDYTQLPSNEEVVGEIGVAPKIPNEFTNGYKFKDGNIANMKTVEEGEKTQNYKEYMGNYEKDGDEVIFSANAKLADEDMTDDVTEYNGVKIYYTGFKNKLVPSDYVPPENETENYTYSYGSDTVEIIDVKGVTWLQDGIGYSLTTMDSPLTRDEIIEMAKEVIGM